MTSCRDTYRSLFFKSTSTHHISVQPVVFRLKLGLVRLQLRQLSMGLVSLDLGILFL